jgi:tape measure domain-containing protein
MGANDINIRIGAKLDGLQRDIKKAQGSLTRFANFAESTGRDLSTRLSLPILGVGAAAVTSFAKFEKLELSLKALAEEGEDTAATFKRLQEIAQLPGISLEQAAKGAAQLRAVGFEGAQAEEILKGLSKAVTLSGEGPEQLGSVVRQLVQMSSKGRILQEDLSVIQENVPSIGIAIQDAFGTNNIEAIRATGVSAQQFTAEIIKAISVNEKFQKVQGGISNEFDNFRQSVTASLAELRENHR